MKSSSNSSHRTLKCQNPRLGSEVSAPSNPRLGFRGSDCANLGSEARICSTKIRASDPSLTSDPGRIRASGVCSVPSYLVREGTSPLWMPGRGQCHEGLSNFCLTFLLLSSVPRSSSNSPSVKAGHKGALPCRDEHGPSPIFCRTV